MKIEELDKNCKAVKTEEVDLGDEKFLEQESSLDLLYTYNRYVRNRGRSGNACAKTRGEISFSGAKPYKQKGTGNARRGTNSTPLKRGGGVVFAPKPRSYKFKLNRRVLKISRKLVFGKSAEKVAIISDKVSFEKTKEAEAYLSKLSESGKCTLLVTVFDANLIQAFRNIKRVSIQDITSFEPETVLASEKVLISRTAFDWLNGSKEND